MFYCWSLKKMTLPTAFVYVNVCVCLLYNDKKRREKKCEESNDADDDGFVRCVLNVD